MDNNEDKLAKAKQLEIQTIISETNRLREYFAKIDTILNQTKHEKPSEELLKENNVVYIMPRINKEYTLALSQKNLTMLSMIALFEIWTIELFDAVMKNQHMLWKKSVRNHLNDIFDTCKIIDVMVKNTYEKK